MIGASMHARPGMLLALAASVTLAAQQANHKFLTMSEPSHHLFADRMAREPMLGEHPGGALFVSGYGADRIDRASTESVEER